jgi:guanine deaminase
VNLKHARDTTDALARIFSLATPADVAGVWTQGVARHGPSLADGTPDAGLART